MELTKAQKSHQYYLDNKERWELYRETEKGKRDLDPEKDRERRRIWLRNNPEKGKQYNSRGKAKMKAKDPLGVRIRQFKSDIWKLYRLTIEEFDRMLIAQSGRCLICGWGMTALNEPCVDHDHETGRIRGLLCATCNGGLGQFFDSVELLAKAIEYLKGSTVCPG